MRKPISLHTVAYEFLLKERESLLPRLDVFEANYKPPFPGFTFNRKSIEDAKHYDSLVWSIAHGGMTFKIGPRGDIVLFDPRTDGGWSGVFHQLQSVGTLIDGSTNGLHEISVTREIEDRLKAELKRVRDLEVAGFLGAVSALGQDLNKQGVWAETVEMHRSWWKLIGPMVPAGPLPSLADAVRWKRRGWKPPGIKLFGMTVELTDCHRLRALSSPEIGRYLEYSEEGAE